MTVQPATHDDLTLCLADLSKNMIGEIISLKTANKDLETRLREIGFAEGDEVEPLHFGLLGSTPVNVRLNGALVALRRQEARAIYVRVVK